ncbi:putative high-glucose-regulated protein [Handroanthus impetiginosus]|uniref:YTH domain-containing family protein n=1 Tax=Handroanthus impetiginosus TaxID=429701 RepID=A0A2G9GC69_9LAMI|nr:putative high-glucose-regulated protein [Handroanthus impetiginosus]
MEDANQQSLDRFAPISNPDDRAVELHNLTEQPPLPKDERIVSPNPSPDAAISGASRNTKDQPATSETSGVLATMHPFNTYAPQEQGYYFGGYDNGSVNWDEHSNYVNTNNLHVIPPAMYNDNSSLFFHPGYGFDSQMAYGQFSPLASPLSPIMIDGQLFSPHQMPVTPPYYPPPVSPGPPHVTSALPASQTELMPPGSSSQENLIDNAFFGAGSGYYLPFGSFGGGELTGGSGLGLYKFPGEFGSSEQLPSRSSPLDASRFMSPLTSGTVYPQPIGILGSYEQNAAQAPFQGFGLMSNSSARHFAHGGSYQSAIGPSSNRNRFVSDKGGRHERDRDSVNVPTDTVGVSSDRNRGPRALKPKRRSSPEEGFSAGIKDVESTSALHVHDFNSPDFITDHERAKFFVIKSFSEDNIHKSIKYSVWASTPLGNRKLDAAYREAKEMEGICPIFLFFSVNASGQFCGVAEMVGPVDFKNDADYWQQDRWSGQFPVKWHIIKDVPNSRFRHILLENNDNKPVTHSRDSQEVKLEQGIEMLKIFKNHDADTSLLDDFNFYDEREKTLVERKAKHRASSTGNTTATLTTESINQLSDSLTDTLRLNDGKNVSKKNLE